MEIFTEEWGLVGGLWVRIAGLLAVGLIVGIVGGVVDTDLGLHCHNPKLSTATGLTLLVACLLLSRFDSVWACRVAQGLAVIGGAHVVHSLSGNAASLIIGLGLILAPSSVTGCSS